MKKSELSALTYERAQHCIDDRTTDFTLALMDFGLWDQEREKGRKVEEGKGTENEKVKMKEDQIEIEVEAESESEDDSKNEEDGEKKDNYSHSTHLTSHSHSLTKSITCGVPDIIQNDPRTGLFHYHRSR